MGASVTNNNSFVRMRNRKLLFVLLAFYFLDFAFVTSFVLERCVPSVRVHKLSTKCICETVMPSYIRAKQSTVISCFIHSGVGLFIVLISKCHRLIYFARSRSYLAAVAGTACHLVY